MKRYITRIIVFFVIIACFDWVFGNVCYYLSKHAKGSDTQRTDYIMNRCQDDVIILGSSRALHHYVSSVLSDSLHQSVYNCGMEGNGIVSQYAVLSSLLERYTPKMVIYDVFAADMIKSDNMRYLKALKPYSNRPVLKRFFNDQSPMELVKLQSNFYKFNNTFVSLVVDCVNPPFINKAGGYQPLMGVMDYDPSPYQTQVPKGEWDDLKKRYFLEMIQLCKQKNIQLVVFLSPYYGATSSDDFRNMAQLCKDEGVPFIDYYSHPAFVHTKSYFQDPSHLNEQGAILYTQKISHWLKQYVD